MIKSGLPQKYHFNWLLIFLAATAMIWIGLVSSRTLLLHEVLTPKNLRTYLFFAAFLAVLPSLTGFLGLKHCFLWGMLGNLTGLGVMFFMLYRGGGWEDITSLLSLAEFSLGGFIIGAAIDIWMRLRQRFIG